MCHINSTIICAFIIAMSQTFLSYEDLRRNGVLSSEANSLQYCLDVELIRPHQFCEDCHSYMQLKTCSRRKFSDGYCWTCPEAEHYRSVRTGSILENRKISFSCFLHLLWLFCNRASACDAARILSMHAKRVRSLFRSLRQCMAEDLMQNGVSTKIGGPGHILEIDESKFGKRKFNSGRRVVGKWVLGGCSRTTGECFLVECPNNRRNHHSLLRLIKLHVHAGTTILTDRWKGYRHLHRHGYTHLTVNHRRGFIDPQTGVHTNTCEGMWFHAKRHMRGGHGRTRTDSAALEIALCEFMWLKKYNITRSDICVRRSFNKEIPQLMIRIFS